MFTYTSSPPLTSYSSSTSASTHSTMAIPIRKQQQQQQAPYASCAFPSWPRRDSLSSPSSVSEEYTNSFISDDDLADLFPTVFDDADADCTPPATPLKEERVVDDVGAYMRQLIAEEKAKRERRARRRSGSSRKSRGSKGKMSPILEGGE